MALGDVSLNVRFGRFWEEEFAKKPDWFDDGFKTSALIGCINKKRIERNQKILAILFNIYAPGNRSLLS